jgi:hypothetical protein
MHARSEEASPSSEESRGSADRLVRSAERLGPSVGVKGRRRPCLFRIRGLSLASLTIDSYDPDTVKSQLDRFERPGAGEPAGPSGRLLVRELFDN